MEAHSQLPAEKSGLSHRILGMFPSLSGSLGILTCPARLRAARAPPDPPGRTRSSGNQGCSRSLEKKGNLLDPNFQPESIPNCEQGNRDNDPEDFGDLIQRHSKGRDPQGSLCQLESLEIMEFWNGMGWVGLDLQSHPLPWALPPGCSKPHPSFPWTFPECGSAFSVIPIPKSQWNRLHDNSCSWHRPIPKIPSNFPRFPWGILLERGSSQAFGGFSHNFSTIFHHYCA